MYVIEESESPAAICLKRNVCTAPKTPAYCAQQKGMRNFHYSSQFKYSSFYLRMIQDSWWQRRGGGGDASTTYSKFEKCSSQSIKSARLSVKSESGPPTPSPQANVATPLWVRGGDTLACEGGGGRTQFRGRDRHSGTLCIL
jgi:hypothetical protein